MQLSVTYPSLQFTTFPEQVQAFVTMLNMTVADAEAVTGYQAAMQAGNNTLAQQYYNQITSANQKFVDATKMNTLMDTCMALEKFYATDIEPYVEAQQDIWETRIDQFNYIGTYSPTQQYEVNNFVTYTVSGVMQVYICISRPTIGTAPTNVTYWRQLSIRGMQGISGENLSFRYAWSSAETYYDEDIVTYDNKVWACIQQNSNQAPVEGSSYWRLIYSPTQIVYPFSSIEPENMKAGYLWLKIKRSSS